MRPPYTAELLAVIRVLEVFALGTRSVRPVRAALPLYLSPSAHGYAQTAVPRLADAGTEAFCQSPLVHEHGPVEAPVLLNGDDLARRRGQQLCQIADARADLQHGLRTVEICVDV